MTDIHPFFELRDENHPKTNIVVAVSRRVVVAVSYPAVGGVVVPRAAAQHTIRTHGTNPPQKYLLLRTFLYAKPFFIFDNTHTLH